MQDLSPSGPNHARYLCRPHQRLLEGAYALSPGEIAGELQHIQTHIHLTSARVRHLQRRINYEGASIARVVELKKQLKEAHNDLENFQQEVESELGRGSAELLGEAGRGVWQAFEQLEQLRNMMEARSDEKEKYLMTGALPVEDEPQTAIRNTTSETMDMLEKVPRLVSQGLQSQLRGTSSDRCLSSPRVNNRKSSDRDVVLDFQETNPERWPQPRDEVIRRLEKEENNTCLQMKDGDRIRRGSCNGFTITDMVMSGVEDDHFVLPYFRYIKHHEVWALKQWLGKKNLIHKRGTTSRMERLVHCILLLQTGSRYESIAVLFSRAPRQIKESFHEVMAGLLELYKLTVDESVESEIYAPLWGITKRCALNADAQGVEKYYGVSWAEIAKVLIALNLYIGRWRGSTSPFAGRPFEWGRYLGVKQARPLSTVKSGVEEIQGSSTSSSANKTSSSSLYEATVIRAIARPVLSS